MNRFESMQILVAIEDNGSLSQASRKLKIPLASVSRKLSELEDHLKVKLLSRTTRAIEFTEYGKSYVSFCRRILEEVDQAERTVSGEYLAPKGQLTLTAPVVFGKMHLIPIVGDFLKANPDVDVRLILSDHSMDLLEDKIDLALRIGELVSSGLIAARVGEIRQITCAAPGYLKKNGSPKNPKELKDHDCVSFTVLNSANKWTYFDKKTKVIVPVHSRLEVTTSEAALEASALGVGITRALSYQVAGYLKTKKLEIILQDFEPKPWPVHLVYPGGKAIPTKLRAFLDFAAPRLKMALAK